MTDCKSNTTHIAALYGNKDWLNMINFRIGLIARIILGIHLYILLHGLVMKKSLNILKYKYINVYRENNKVKLPKDCNSKGHNECLQIMQQYYIKLKI